MAKLKIIFLSIAFCWSIPLQAYNIDELVKILIDKNENNSAFKYDDQIDDITCVAQPLSFLKDLLWFFKSFWIRNMRESHLTW